MCAISGRSAQRDACPSKNLCQRNRMTRNILVVLLLLLAVSASAQVRVTGRVTTLSPSSGGAGGGLKPVSDVIVKLVSGTKTLAFTSTNVKGEYALELKSMPTGMVTLQFNHISYEKESLPLPPPNGGGKPIVQDMVLTPKNISLKEVTVKPDPLRQRGDTLTYNLASFLMKGDVTLEDGLNNLPGMRRPPPNYTLQSSLRTKRSPEATGSEYFLVTLWR